MYCKRCGSIMVEAHMEVSAHSVQTWYACTICRYRMLSSEPVRVADRGPYPSAPREHPPRLNG